MTQLKIKIAELTPESCKDAPELAKYFFVNNKHLDRFHIPSVTAEEYAELAKSFKTTSRFNKKNLDMNTATDYYIRKARLMKVANDLGISVNLLDAKDYIWDERYYTEYSLMRNFDVVEDAWRISEEDPREFSSYKVYCQMDGKGVAVDMKEFDALYQFCYRAVLKRRAMLLCKVDKCIGFLQSIIASTNGFSENMTGEQRATLARYVTFFSELAQDEEASTYIASTNDIEVFANNEDTKKDYIETYRSMLKGLTKCRSEDLEHYRTEMSLVEDPYLEKILADEEDFEDCLSGTYLTDASEDEDEIAIASGYIPYEDGGY